MEGIIGITILVGGIPTPLKNMKVNEKDDIPYIMEHKNQQTITVGGHALRFLLFACPSTFGPSQRLSSVTSPLATPFSSSKSLGVFVQAHGEFDETRYPLVICYIAIENCDLQWIYPLKMVIFHGYVSLPEDIQISHCQMDQMGGCYAKTS